MESVIKTVNLRKAYRVGNEKVVALDCINLEIPKGQVCCILGTSGSGKSTLLNQLAGLEKPTRGEVYIKNKKISVMTEKQLAHFRQRNVGFVFQSYNLLQGMSAIDNVAIPMTFRGVSKTKRIKLAKEMLKKVGLGKRMSHKPKEMSGGQQQRVGIARAFVAKPDVVFADEPTGNLDTRTTREIMDLFLEFSRHYGITIVLVSHDQNLARYADRIVTLVDGEIIGDKLNHSLYDVTNELRELVKPMVQNEQYDELAKIVLKYTSEYTEGVCVQALEDNFTDLENPQKFMETLIDRIDNEIEKSLFLRIGRETGAIPKETDSKRLAQNKSNREKIVTSKDKKKKDKKSFWDKFKKKKIEVDQTTKHEKTTETNTKIKTEIQKTENETKKEVTDNEKSNLKTVTVKENNADEIVIEYKDDVNLSEDVYTDIVKDEDKTNTEKSNTEGNK